MSGPRWLAGDAEARAAIERALRDPAGAGARVLRERPGRRRLLRVPLAEGALFVKQGLAPARPGLRTRGKRALGLDAVRREWRALCALWAAGVAVPRPRALALLPGGGSLLASDWIEGVTLREWLAEPGRGREGARAVGHCVAALHRAGFVHRDLHAGNLLMAGGGAVLVDLQLAWRSSGRRGRLRDLGELDHSLQGRLSLAHRVALRAEALGLERPFGERARRSLRAAGDASLRRARAHAASRMRRSDRPGRLATPCLWNGARGLRLRELDPAELARSLEAAAAPIPGSGPLLLLDAGRGHVVRRFPAPRGWRALRLGWRGSPARRAWRGGHGLLAHRLGVARPLAYVERRRFGLRRESAVVFADPRPARPLCEVGVSEAAAAAHAVAAFLLRLHERGIEHRELGVERIWVDAAGARLVDPENLRFARSVPDAKRARAWRRLDAGLPECFPPALRRRARRHAAALGPPRTPAQATETVIQR